MATVLMMLFVIALAAALVVTLMIAGVYLRAAVRVLAWFAASAALWMGGDKDVWRNWCAETGEISTGLAWMRAVAARIPAGTAGRVAAMNHTK